MNHPIIVTDNVECLRILADVGIADKLYPEPPYTRAHSFFDYKGYHCVATYDKGHSDEMDNGFMIIMLPTAMGQAAAYKLLEEIMEETLAEPGGSYRCVNLGKDLQ